MARPTLVDATLKPISHDAPECSWLERPCGFDEITERINLSAFFFGDTPPIDEPKKEAVRNYAVA
jgi:hypothetical protein